MKAKAHVFHLWVGILLLTLCGAVRTTLADDQNLVQVPEAVLRKLATRIIMPVYPVNSKNQGNKGVAVVQLRLNEKGVLTYVEVLEAPDQEIAEAVNKAIKQWKFKVVYVDDKPRPVEGKLTFYFVINEGIARVENPRKFKSLNVHQ